MYFGQNAIWTCGGGVEFCCALGRNFCFCQLADLKQGFRQRVCRTAMAGLGT